MSTNEHSTKSDVLFVLVGLGMSLSAGTAEDVFPDFTFLPLFLAFLAGFFVGCPVWKRTR
jgi:hypothetical protein